MVVFWLVPWPEVQVSERLHLSHAEEAFVLCPLVWEEVAFVRSLRFLPVA